MYLLSRYLLARFLAADFVKKAPDERVKKVNNARIYFKKYENNSENNK